MSAAPRISAAVATYASDAFPTVANCSHKKNATNDQTNPGSIGLRGRKKRWINTAMAATKLKTVQVGIDPSECVGLTGLFSGRHIIAKTTDSRNSKPRRGAVPAMLKPRSRIKVKTMKLIGTSKAARAAAVRPGPE